ncbi:MAG: lipocalin family protein [Desulforhabdus sp.]|nr:lipocalin family protein [Desulforhabdus sp.]
MRIPFGEMLSELFNRREYPVHTVDHVDLQRFQGRWYEIAAVPAWFEKECRCTVSEYSYVDEQLKVKNSCRKNGKNSTMTAVAYPAPDSGNSQLRLQYFWPLKRDYWIIARDEDYQYAVIGHPTRKYLWLLAREPFMDEAVYKSMVETARAKGYDVSKLIRTDQSCFE